MHGRWVPAGPAALQKRRQCHFDAMYIRVVTSHPARVTGNGVNRPHCLGRWVEPFEVLEYPDLEWLGHIEADKSGVSSGRDESFEVRR